MNCALFLLFNFSFYRGKSSKNAGNSWFTNFFDDRARTDGTKAIPSRCFNFDSKLLNLFQPLRQLYIFVRFRRFYSHGILTKEHNRFTLSRKPTWISFKRRCCENSSQLSQQSMSETCLRPALRHLFALISMLSIETKFPFEPLRTPNFNLRHEHLPQLHIWHSGSRQPLSMSTDRQLYPAGNRTANGFPALYGGSSDTHFIHFTVWVDLRDYW